MRPRRPGVSRTASTTRGSAGQSFVELALVLPVLLILLVLGLDAGRVFLGSITLNNTARVAANFAALHPTANWSNPSDPITSEYAAQIRNEAQTVNCTLPNPLPLPTFPDGTDVGDRAVVDLNCSFSLITPLAKSVLPSGITVGSDAVFAIRAGSISGLPASPGGPVANFSATPTSGYTPLAVSFTDLSTNNPTSWAWDLNGDGTIDSTTRNPAWTYTSAGTYAVSLTVTNGFGFNTMTKVGYITVAASGTRPTAAFTASATTVAAGQSITFYDQSLGLPTSWAWTFGGGTPGSSTVQNPVVTYNTVGTYDVTLTATNAFGSDSKTAHNYITVVPFSPPIASFTVTQQCDRRVLFTDTSGGGPTAWHWDFGDNATSAAQNPSHKYATAGPFTVTLAVSNLSGNSTASKSVTPPPPFVADFVGTPTSGGNPLTVQFTDKSGLPTPSTWSWNFGQNGNSTSTAQNPTNKYASKGTYTVSLSVTVTVGGLTCNASTTKTGYITVQ